jgi:hypothetical protein
MVLLCCNTYVSFIIDIPVPRHKPTLVTPAMVSYTCYRNLISSLCILTLICSLANIDLLVSYLPITSDSSSEKAMVFEPTPVKIRFAFITIGEVPQRFELIYENLTAFGLSESLHGGRYQIDCLLFSFASYPTEPQCVHDMENSSTSRCEMILMNKMDFIGFLKVLIPSIIRDSGYKSVFLSLDDVALTAKHGATFDIVKFF